jgi:hypothetical protein
MNDDLKPDIFNKNQWQKWIYQLANIELLRMKDDEDIVLNTYVRSRLGMGLPPRPPPISRKESLTDNTDRLTSEKDSLFNMERESNDELYMESVLKEVGEDLDQMIDCIEDYRRLLESVRKSEE